MRVSVVIPTYNRAGTIVRAVDSALNQTFPDIRVIVVDDGSTDDTQARIDSAFDRNRVTCVRLERNRGAAAARNCGLRLCDGELVAFLDSDDAWYPQKVERQVRFLQQTGADVVFCSVERVERGRRVLCPPKPVQGDIHQLLLRGNFVATGMILGRRACFAEGFDERLPRLQDWELMLRVSQQYAVRHLHEPLAAYMPQRDSLSSDPQKLKTAVRLVFDRHRAEFEGDAQAFAAICRQMAVAEIMTGGPSAAAWLRRGRKSSFSPEWGAVELLCAMGMAPLLCCVEQRRLSRRYE